MPLTSLPLQFASDFVWLGVAIGGLTLVLLGRGMTATVTWARLSLTVGFAAMGVAAFIRGVFEVGGPVSAEILVLRLLAVAALAVGGWRWPLGTTRIALYLFGLLCMIAGALSGVFGSAPVAGDAATLVGGLALTAVLLGACRRSIVARVVASAACALLLVVVVLSAPLTGVLSNSTTTSERSNLADVASLISSGVDNRVNEAMLNAGYAGADLNAEFASAGPNPLIVADQATGSPDASQRAAQQAIRAELGLIHGLNSTGTWVYVTSGGHGLAAPGVHPALAAELASLKLNAATSCGRAGARGGLVVLGRDLYAVGAYPECQAVAKASLTSGTGAGAASAARRKLGVLIRAQVLDSSYLKGQVDTRRLSLAFFGRHRLYAAGGPHPSFLALRGLVKSGGPRATGTLGNRYVALDTVLGSGGRAVAEIAVSAPVAATHSDLIGLFRALFLIALGGTILAFWLTLAISDRITAGLRRLTVVSRRIQSGQTRERVRLHSPDEVGTLAGAFDSMLDAIDRQQAALSQAADDEALLRDRLQAVVAGMGEALVALNATGEITDFNRAAERLLGVRAAEAVGRSLESVVELSSASGAPLDAAQTAILRPEQPVQARLRRRDGTVVPVAVSAGTLGGAPGPSDGSVLVLRDLRGEQELERMKSELLSRVGHELRTPLTGIIGYANMLLHRRVTPDQSKLWHAQILEAAKRELRIVEMLEFFTAAGGGRAALHPEMVIVAPLVSSLVSTRAARLDDRYNLSLEVDDERAAALADRRWLSVALDELLDNAIKFSPEGGPIVVRVGTGSGPIGTEGRYVTVTVRDRGLGIPPAAQESIFDEFVQLDASDTRAFGGLGLGLTLVRRVVDAYGGFLSCTSDLGEGTSVTVGLPTVAPATRRSRREWLRAKN